jgi:hypothetical protein
VPLAGPPRLSAQQVFSIGDDGGDAVVVVGIEKDRGPSVAALTAAAYVVFAVNPLQASRFRQPSGAGDQERPGGCASLADTVRTDSHQLPPAAEDSAQAAGVKVLAARTRRWCGSGPGRCSVCGRRCWSTSRPRWRPSATWPPPPVHSSCWASPRTRPGPEADPRPGIGRA